MKNVFVEWCLKAMDYLGVTPWGVLSLCVTGVVIPAVLFYYSKDKRKARKWLRLQSAHAKNQIAETDMAQQLFGGESKAHYYRHVNYDATPSTIRHTSYILLGESGCGKLSMLKNRYIHDYYSSRLHFGSFVIFFSSLDMLRLTYEKECYQEWIDRIRTAEPKKLVIYCDGLDESGIASTDCILSFIKTAYSNSKELKICVSCRTRFNHNNHLHERISQIVSTIIDITIMPWQEEQLIEFSKVPLSFVKKKERDSIKTKCTMAIQSGNINSPLLVVMYTYLLMHYPVDTDQILSPSLHRYTFYNSFITALVRKDLAKENCSIASEQIIRDLSTIVFKAYKENKRNIHNTTPVTSLFKRIEGSENNQILLHESFWEFFIARHFVDVCSRASYGDETIVALATAYPNDYADFISDALKESPEDKQVEMIYLFFHTFYLFSTSETKDDVLSLFNQCKLDTDWAKDMSIDNDLSTSWNLFEKEEQLFLKYEICFRLGRFPEEILLNERCAFLKAVYKSLLRSSDISCCRNDVILLRSCAISTSFMGDTELEMDYVRHMLPFMPEYCPIFDEVNRAHTLLFYGDVIEQSIHTFEDNNPVVGWKNARNKRIQRLSFNSPLSLTDMGAKDKRLVYFRLFDIATIYTFLNNRQGYIPTDKEKQIIRNMNPFIGDYDRNRADLIERVKKETIELIRSRNSKI